MNRDKQIDEMAKICRGYFNGKCYAKGEAQECNLICSRGDIMRDLYTAGYRKASEVAREIFEEIEERLQIGFPKDVFITMPRTSHDELWVMVRELKKKYTEGER